MFFTFVTGHTFSIKEFLLGLGICQKKKMDEIICFIYIYFIGNIDNQFAIFNESIHSALLKAYIFVSLTIQISMSVVKI